MNIDPWMLHECEEQELHRQIELRRTLGELERRTLGRRLALRSGKLLDRLSHWLIRYGDPLDAEPAAQWELRIDHSR